MSKRKLILVRKKKGYTQQQVADFIATDVSNYSRKESGNVKIISDEWEKIARFLEVPVEEIYEPEPISSKYLEKLDDEKKLRFYISTLENENKQLREEIDILKLKMEQAINFLSK